MDGRGDGVHERLLAAPWPKGKGERGEGRVPQLVVGNAPCNPALGLLEQRKEPCLDGGQIVRALDLAHLSCGHARIGESNYDLFAIGSGEPSRPSRAPEVEIGIAKRLCLVDGDGFADGGYVTRHALYLVDDERMFAVVDNTVGPSLHAEEEAVLVAHHLFANLKTSGMRTKDAVGKEDGSCQRHLRLVSLATRGLEHAVDIAASQHGLDPTVSVALRIYVS